MTVQVPGHCLPLLTLTGDWLNVLPFPMNKLLPNDTETFYRYEGSLTTPPCSESVIWTVFRQHIEISEEQVRPSLKEP